MSDTNLTTSIQAIRTKILNDITTATVDQLLALSRAAKSVGLTEDSDIENAVNSRVNALSSGATTEEMVKLSNAIKQVRNSSQSALSPSATSDDIVEGTTNKYMSDANLQALGSAIIPATDATHDLGSPTNKFRDLYLDNNTLYFGTTQFTSDDILNFDLSVQPETLEIQVSADEAGHGTHWDWTWTQSALPYARTAITETPLNVVPLYMQGTYQINNFANTQYGSMTQTHSFKLKWIEGAGNDNLVSWATTTTVNHSHPDINGGNSTSVERLAVNVPSTITPPTLTAPSVTYTVGSTTGAYVFSGTAVGNNPEIGPFYRGGTYTININASGHPFYFTTDNGTNFAANTYFGEYTNGVTGSRTDSGTITFTVPAGAPDVLYYQCGVHSAMRGTIRVKDLAVETNANGNYLIYGQHTQESHAQTIELRPIPTLTSQMCLVYDSSTNKFVPQDLSTYVENTPAFENKIKEVAGTATLIAPDGTSLVASVNIYSDATYLPAVGNTVGDIAFVEDTQKLYIYKATGWIETVANADLTGLATEAFVQNYVANNVSGGNVVEYTSTNTAATNDIVMLNSDGTVTVVEPTNYPFDQQTAIDTQMTSGYIGDLNYRGMIAHHSTREKGMLIFPGGTGHNDRTMLVVFSRNGSGISKGTAFSSGEPINNFKDQHAFFGPAGAHEDKFLYLGAAASGGYLNVGTGNITGTTVNTTGTDSSSAYSDATNNGQLDIGIGGGGAGGMAIDHGGFSGTVLTLYLKFIGVNGYPAVRKFTYDFANQYLDRSFPEIELSTSEAFEWEHTAIDPSTPTRIALYRQEGSTSTRRGIIKFADVDWDAGTINIGPSADLFTRSGSHNVDAWEIQNKQAFHPTNGLLAAVTTSPPDGGGDAPYRLKVALYSADANLNITNVSGNLTLMSGANVKVGTVRGNIAWTKGSNTGSTPNAPILITPIISNQTGSSPQTRYLQYDNSGNYITQTTDSNTFDSGSMWTYSSPFNDGDTASYSPDTVNSQYPQVIMTQGPYGESNFDATKLHGVAASAGTTIDVTLEHGIHTGLSGLTTGTKYFVTDSGGISTSGSAKLGTAINATSLALDFTDELTSADLGTYATKAYVGQQITAAGSYNDASVDLHLNQSTATSNEVLSWNGTDYEWVTQPTNNNQLTNGAGFITAADIPNANAVEYTSTASASVNDVVMLNTDGTVTPVEVTTTNANGAVATLNPAGGAGSNFNKAFAGHFPSDPLKVLQVYRSSTTWRAQILEDTVSTYTWYQFSGSYGGGASEQKSYPFVSPIDESKVLWISKDHMGTTGAQTFTGHIFDVTDVNNITVTSTTHDIVPGMQTLTDSNGSTWSSTSNLTNDANIIYDYGNSSSGSYFFNIFFQASTNAADPYVIRVEWDGQNAPTFSTPIRVGNQSGFDWNPTNIKLDPNNLGRLLAHDTLGRIRVYDIDYANGTSTLKASYQNTDIDSSYYDHAADWNPKVPNQIYSHYGSNQSYNGANRPRWQTYTFTGTSITTDSSDWIWRDYSTNEKYQVVSLDFLPNSYNYMTVYRNRMSSTTTVKESRIWDSTGTGNGIFYMHAEAIISNASNSTYMSHSFDYNTNSAHGSVYYQDSSNSSLRFFKGKLTTSNLDASKVHGIAATSGTTIDVTVENGIHTGLSGLTVGSKYYVLEDGSISSTPDTNDAKVGLAITSTSLALDFTDELTSADLGTYATKSYVATQVANLVDSAPTTLDTLNELAAALGDDANFSTTVTNSLANKADTSSLANVATSGSYNDLSNKPTIPTNNNQLTNGAGYITAADVPNANAVEYTSTSSASVNDVVMLNTNGTVTPVEPTSYPVNSQIALSTIGSAHGDNSPHYGLGMIAHKPTDRNSGMVVYRDQNNENHTISSFTASGGSFSISSTATVSQTSENMKLYPFFDPFDDTKVLLLYTRLNDACCKIVDTAANGSISINAEINLGAFGSISNKHFEVDMVNSTSGDVKIICSVPGYVTQLTWDGTNITAGTPIATTNNGYHRFSLGQDGLFAMISGTSLRAGKVNWAGGTVSEGASSTVTDNGNQAYAVSESGKIAYAFYDGDATKISTFSIDSSTYACTLLHTSDSIDNRYNSGTPRPHDIMFAPGGESFGYSWYGSDRQNASSSDNKAILGTVASNGTITFISTTNPNVGQMYSFFPTGQADTAYRFLAASEWSNSMSQKGLVGFYSLKFNNYNPISQLRLLDFPYSESNLDVSKIHGLAASSGTTIDVTIENGIHTGLSGLTVGSKYYILENGTLSTSPDSNNAKVGLAITSTSLALDFADELTDASLATYATKSYVDTSVANLSTTVTNSLANKADTSSLAAVATSGSYNDLSNKPTIPTIDTSVTTVSSPTVNLDLNNSNFKIDLNANSTTVTTSNNPSTGLHEYTFEIKGNASQDTHNIQSNPSNAITNWRTTQQSSITGFTVGVSNYNAFAASPDGQYAVVYQAYSSSNKQLTVFKMSTPGDVTTATSHLVINNISVSAGGRTDHLGMRPSIYFLSDNVTINMFGKTYNAETGSNNNNGAGSHSPFYEYSNKGNWTPDGLHFYAPTGDPNFNKIKRWDATAPFDWSTASLVSTTTMTYQSNSVMSYYGPDKAIHVSGDGTKLIAVGKYISNNHSNYAIDTYSLSTPFDPASATYVGQYTVANGGAIHFGSFTNDGNTYMYSDDDRLKSFTNLATTPVLNTITWPNNFYWEGGSAPTATPNDETDIVRFATTDSGSTFNAWVEKDSDKSAGFDGQYSSLTGAPTLATVATSGSYNDLSNQPTIPSISGLATETYVNTQVSNLVDSAPATLDTLNELAAALGDDANFSTTITNQIAAKADAYSIATVTASGGNFYIDGVQQVTLSFEPGRTYRFDQADSSNGSHPLRFSTTSDGTHGGGSEYTTGVTTNGTAGSAGAYVQIAITNATPTLYYYCVNHSGMGAGSVVGNFSGNYNDLTNLPTLFDGQFSSLTGTPSLYTDSAVDTHLNISGATTGQILSWNGTDYAWIDAAAGGGSSVSVSATAPSSPSEGDLWFDEDDLVMYVWYTDGDSSQWIEANSVTAAAATIHASDTAPSGPSSGDLWFNTTLLDLYVYYADGDSNQWVQVGGAANSQTSGSGGGSSVQSLIETANTSVTTTDTGTDGHIDFTTNGTARWEITSNGHILPHTNASFDIGSAEKKVRYLFLDSNTMFVGDTSFSEDNIDRSMEVYTDQSAPSSSTDEGKKGDVRIVGNYMYVCINTNEWIRTQIEKDW